RRQASHLSPRSRVSVTASPNLTLDDTIDLAQDLVQDGFRVTPHLSARMVQNRAHLNHLMDRLADLEVERVFVVGGDADEPGEFFDGLSLLEAMAEIGHDYQVGIPSYPEGHPDIPDNLLIKALVDKAPFASWMTSQMCFDGKALERWLRTVRSRNISLPLVLGLPGVADRTKLLRISTRIGVGRSLAFLRQHSGLLSS